MANVTTAIVQKELKEDFSAIEIAKKYRLTRQAIYWHIDKIKKKKRKKKKKKKNYNLLINWKLYNEGLVKRGEFLLDFSFFQDWKEELNFINSDKPGRPYQYPHSFILFFLRLKSIFKIDYRTLEGVARKLIESIFQTNKAPDYTTFHIRLKRLKIEIDVYQKTEKQDIAGDTSGLKTSNRGEYRISKYRGKKREFVKLHLTVNTETKQVVHCNVTPEQVRDCEELPNMVSSSSKYGRINNGYFDAGYDSKDNYQLLKEREINPVIRPRRSSSLVRIREKINQIEQNGTAEGKEKNTYTRLKVLEEFLTNEEEWKKKYGYGKRWVVEDRYSVFKRLFSEHVYSKKIKNMKQEVIIKVNLMNLFTSFLIGSKKSISITQMKKNYSDKPP